MTARAPRPIVLNGRAAVRGTFTGVERWAVEVNFRLKRLRPERYAIVQPERSLRRATGHLWEQTVLPARAARLHGSVIFSPANLAPVGWPRNVVVLHDAAMLRNASSYSRTYRTAHSWFGTGSARRALRVITVSEFSRGELIELAGIAPERAVVIRGGVSERFTPDADSGLVRRKYALSWPYVLTVGTDDPRKNLAALSAAAQRLNTHGIELVWAGGSQGHIPSAGFLRGARHLGYVSDEDLPGLYAGASAFVLPSLYEGFGLPCLEAMACGTPVVASNRAALPETCGDAALLVDPDHVDQLAEAVIRAATDDQLRSQLRTAGLARAAGLSWDRTAAETDALLMGLADQ